MNISFEWGLSGFDYYQDRSDLLIIVDTLCFSTSVTVALSRGALVLPFALNQRDRAEQEAKTRGAILARKRSERTYSLSPHSLLELPEGAKLVLPSPNGSHIAARANETSTILLGCLRNARAVSNYVREHYQGKAVTLIAAGERWPDGSLRPALEDLLGCGAILSRLEGDFSSEATLASHAFRSARINLSTLISTSISGRELIEHDFQEDVRISLELNESEHIPILKEGWFKTAVPTA
ncbi:2-phosphosulfolactate phosphatase [Flexibacterium corallicola]|uniref:2-phosphosulfolactate phosphatase n=1 Tax=Flexibacterium corallicola TaxID=3037259 RepID=UPI00286ECF93|nr:2-phosphosulfolactate phosphatase [Pseudovibrio sp. M1P-2-3]